MDWVYDGQVKRYLTQFMRIMSNFSYKDAKGNLTRFPVSYGDPSRQVSAILKKNSENTIPSAPFIACYIKDLQLDNNRRQDPSFVSKVNVRERAYDDANGQYLNQQGSNFTVERLMPTPYLGTFAADIWTSNTDQKLQIFEQLSYLFNPSLELQTTDNYIDWTSISVLTLKSQVWTSRQIPQGVEQNIDILNMTFETPMWISPPAKVKQLGIITKIITSAFSTTQGVINGVPFDENTVLESIGAELFQTVVTPGNYDLLVLDNVATLIPETTFSQVSATNTVESFNSWKKILDLYPSKFRVGYSQLRLTKPSGQEIVAFMSLDPLDEKRMILTFDADTIPANTIIGIRGTVDAIINPETFNPDTPVAGTRYLILENIHSTRNDGPVAWQQSNGDGFSANANDIIEWDGANWNVIFNSEVISVVTYITNSYTGIQYKWEDNSWSKSFEGVYEKAKWRLIL
jgi:hypothetical protein